MTEASPTNSSQIFGPFDIKGKQTPRWVERLYMFRAPIEDLFKELGINIETVNEEKKFC